ncbi:hypothetical protein PY092_08370 [Muricauda sp. 334s03]|uniref:Uncharacterized protein n=1 Tax=Flagellimonas yonaguniensis TaxID=3031325 RepID=A0ABT5XY87_9FLAO|nr:hypothetical protein [[Muricauda] yonaguniensis]MDF0716156.1 hypothetical protein [[Muricauda] yonaguniensis]
MPFPNKSNDKHKQLAPKTFEAIEGLDDFIKDLERYFFATVKLKCKHNIVENRLDLVVDLHFNFSIADCLSHLSNGDWGNYSISEESSCDMCTAMKDALKKLNQKSTYPADVMETSLHFTDTSIVISRLYLNSIPEHIGKILTTVSQHFIYFTKGLTEMPYEVFVPVFEDKTIRSHQSKMDTETNYYTYWGLYFENDGPDEHEALIYSLGKKKFFEESIFLFE